MDKINSDTKFIDGLGKKRKVPRDFDLSSARFVAKYKKSSIFFSKNGQVSSFFTEDSKLYVTPDEYRKMQDGERMARFSPRFDSALSRTPGRNEIRGINKSEAYYFEIKSRYSSLNNYIQDLFGGAVRGVSVAKMWNLSIVGAVIFGMLTMTMIYRYLGQGVSAAVQEKVAASQEEMSDDGDISGKNVIDYNGSDKDEDHEIDTSFITKLLEDGESGDPEEKKSEFEKQIREMVKGYPIEKMVPEIVKKDRTVAAFLIAIAKKESAWGKRVPVLNGQDCFNYWGYRGIRDKMGTGGHTCFDSPKDAVDTVAKRIEFLVSNKKLNTPGKMVIWKCGSNCAITGGQAAADKWIRDVALYFDKLNKE